MSLDDYNSTLFKDKEIVGYSGNTYTMVLNCSVAAYDLDYSLINGTFLQEDVSLRLSDADTVTLSRRWTHYNIMKPQFQLSANSAMIGSNTSQQVANKYASLFEQSLVAFSATAFDAAPVTFGQTRHQVLVARVPKAPFTVLVILYLLLVLQGRTLSVVILCQQPARVLDIRLRLGLFGLVAAFFETWERSGRKWVRRPSCFEETKGRESNMKVGIVRECGRWRYATVPPASS
jgi:hypothetical protein